MIFDKKDANTVKIIVKMVRYDSGGKAVRVEQCIRRLKNTQVDSANFPKAILIVETEFAAGICADKMICEN